MKPKKNKINIAGIITTPGSTAKTKSFSFRHQKPVTDFKKCIKCGMCWIYCPDMAFSKKQDGTFKNIEKFCKGCGICMKVCPVKCIKMEIVKR
jgi:pyruvate ferredoxin oxidoreductase delta subunit